MNRLLMIGSLAALLVGATGCLHHNVNSGCNKGICATGDCSGSCDCSDSNRGSGSCCNGKCAGGACGAHMIDRLGSLCGLCGAKNCNCGYRTGCQAGPLGWQQGGLDYSSHLNPGLCGHHAHHALMGRPQYGGLPSAQVGYPYYTIRGPRDFLVDNPPSIGR